MSAKPTAAQAETIAVLTRNGGRIERWDGGFWTYPGCPVARLALDRGREYRVPEWYVAQQTVVAMVRRGWLERLNVRVNAQLDDHRLTPAAYET